MKSEAQVFEYFCGLMVKTSEFHADGQGSISGGGTYFSMRMNSNYLSVRCPETDVHNSSFHISVP